MKPSPWPLWIAHRGAGKLAPENTLAAFRLGAQHGYNAFECDVKLSADDMPFLLHDATLERTTNARGTAGERTWAELARLDAGSWHSAAHAGEPLPTLDAVAAFCHEGDHALNIEIKPTPGVEAHTGRVVASAAQRLWAGRTLPPLLSSFSPEALEGARDAAPLLPRALLVDAFFDGWLERAQALACVAIVANWRLFDAELVRRLHGVGLWAMSYTVNEASAARRLLEWGLDGLITDAVDRFAPRHGRVLA
jgi:glycerophosphoryl diester phosphodiesterase